MEAFEPRILMAGDVSGVIFGDMDRDGVRDSNETIVPNAQITALDANNKVVGSATSDSAGKFKLNVSTQSTRVRLKVQDPGSNLSPVTTEAQVNAVNLFVPCGCDPPPTAQVCGNVFDDLNNDGVRQAGEPGIAGATIKLSGKDAFGNAVSRTTQTASDGTYCFTDLPASDSYGYTVQETQPAGYDDGKDTPGTLGGLVSANDTISKIVVPDGAIGKNYDFGEIRQRKADACIQGSVYVDANNDGVRQAGEAGIPNASLSLIGTDYRGNPVNLSIKTDANGYYSFVTLLPGTYKIVETQPSGFDDGKDTPGNQGGDASVNDVISNIKLGESVKATGYNFGELIPANACITGSVYVDANNDGIRQGGEAGIPGAKVQLTGTDVLGNAVSLSATTDANGNYKFASLRPGAYKVAETQPAGFDDGKDTAGSLGGDASVNDIISNIVLGSGQTGSGYNFGELIPANACIQGSVYVDANNDGIRQGGEAGIPGVKVQLTGTDVLGNAVSLSATTDSSGNYKFNSLRPGAYTVKETQPAGFNDGKDTPGSKGGDASINDVISNILLNAGETASGYNFGELVPANACITGAVYVDANNDGIRQGGEAGIPNVKVQLTGTDSLGNAVNLTAYTDANGNYKFNGLRPGTYKVAETQPSGFDDGKDTPGSKGGDASVNDMISNIVLNASETASGYNFGELVPANACIQGSVYVDANNDGIRQGGEAGISGAKVQLTGTDVLGNAVSLSATTDSNGNYKFNSLRPGAYTVKETQPAGYTDGKDTPGSKGGDASVNDIISNILLNAGETASGYNFGELIPANACITGSVYVDTNNDGIRQGGEAGIPGAKVQLTGTDVLGNAVSLSATTDANGNYKFASLRPGTYKVAETQPSGFDDGKDTPGSKGGDASVNDVISNIVLNAGETASGYNFGEIVPANSAICGAVYVDANNDGIRQPAEKGIPNAKVRLQGIDDFGNPVDLLATTDANGNYKFSNLRPGTYTVKETQPGGFEDGKDTAGSLGGDASVNDVISNIVLGSAQTGTGYNFGELAPANASISGSVYVDVNDDGVRQGSEAGIPNVKVQLTGTNDLGSPVSLSATTDANGNYKFNGLRPGTYSVKETQPAGFDDGKDTAGSNGGDASVNDVISKIILNASDNATGYNFGECKPSSLSGQVYKDLNSNGKRDAGEPGIAGVCIKLSGVDSKGKSVYREVRTNSNGEYLFDNLRPGKYELTESQPSGFLQGQNSVGSLGGVLVPDCDIIKKIVINHCEQGTGYDFGEVEPTCISGSVYVDKNRNGSRDSYESGIYGVCVTLKGTDDLGRSVNKTIYTDSHGRFSFEGLRPGTYSLIESQPKLFKDGAETVGDAGGEKSSNDVISNIKLKSGVKASGYAFGEQHYFLF